jgi:two-component system sensor histidine kinase QseC
MRSIQSNLVRGLTIVLLLTSLVTGGGLCLWLRHTLIEDFDRSLSQRAATLQSLVTIRQNGELDVESDLLAGGFQRKHRRSEYVQLDDGTGTPLYPSRGEARLPLPPEGGHPYDLRLPDGRTGRAVARWFEPEYEDADGVIASSRPAARTSQVRVIVARDRHELDETLAEVVAAVACGTLFLSIMAVGASVLIVRRGLSGLRQISQSVAAIDPTQPAPGFVDRSQPAELMPIATRLDELIERVSQTLSRERQFSVAASHELRTPIAELLVVTEVALRDPGDAELNARALREAHQIGTEMRRLVSTLLDVARLSQSGQRLPAAAINVETVVSGSIQRYEKAFAERQLTATRKSTDALAFANDDALRVVIDNLLSNAAKYAIPGTEVSIDVATRQAGIELSIANLQDQLGPADVTHLFDPFWQKDPSRSGSGVGLGLTLVRAYVGAMGGSVRAAIDQESRLVVTCVLPVPPAGCLAEP